MQLTRTQIHNYFERRHPGQQIPDRDKVSVKCAFHSEDDPSCTLFLDGSGGFNCHACGAKGNLFQFEAQFSSCSLEQAEINVAEITGAEPKHRNKSTWPTGPVVAEYIYRDAHGNVVFKKQRFDNPKDFRCLQPDGRGGWIPHLRGIDKKPLYNLPRVTRSNALLKTEGEKDSDRVQKASAGFPTQDGNVVYAATCNFDGASKGAPKWNDEDSPLFEEKFAFIFEDNDAAGRAEAQAVAVSVSKFALEVRIVTFRDQAAGYDVSKYLETHTPQQLFELMESTPVWVPPADAVKPPGNIRPDLVCLADVKAKPVPWLWKLYLAFGMLAMLSGDPDAGKTFIALAIAASLSNGQLPVTGEDCEPVVSLYLSHENAAEFVTRPRFDALGGNAARFHLLKGSIYNDGEDSIRAGITLKDVALLEAAVVETGAKLIIIDPIQSYMGAEVDAHRSNETRPVMDGLIELAQKHNVCILILRHLSKASGGRAIHRGLGSIDLTGAVRTEMLAGSAPGEPKNRALVQIKNNLGPQAGSLGYQIVGTEMKAKLEWLGESKLSAEDLLSPDAATEDRSDIDEAEEFIREQLKNGPKRLRDLKSASGIPEWTLSRAARKVGIERSREGERGPWVWRLADHTQQPNAYTTTQGTVAYAKNGRVCSADHQKAPPTEEDLVANPDAESCDSVQADGETEFNFGSSSSEPTASDAKDGEILPPESDSGLSKEAQERLVDALFERFYGQPAAAKGPTKSVKPEPQVIDGKLRI
jgi:AAA domain-containing protein/CHC2-type zinc finger protein